MADEVIPMIPVIDYTGRDYLSLRQNMIDTARMRIPNWAADNPSDFGIALIEAFAYGLDTVHYYLDRIAGEAYLSTAIQRESLYAIADMFNYVPKKAAPATVVLDFVNTSTTKKAVLPAGTRCQTVAASDGTSISKNFETVEEVTLDVWDGTSDYNPVRVQAVEGHTYKDESVGVSNGFAQQQYFIRRTSVLPNTVTVETELKAANGAGESSFQKWDEIDTLAHALPGQKVFQVLDQMDGSSLIRFGDGVYGAIPPLHSIIRASYRVGGGSDGNVSPNSVKTIVYPEITNVQVDNSEAAVGGRGSESLTSIRINAARSFRSRDRAVTLSDFVALAENAPDISKAKAIGNNGTSVAVYVVPNSDEGLTRNEDGLLVTTMTPELRESTAQFLENRAMAGVTVQVFDPVWVEVYLRLRVFAIPDYPRDKVEQTVREALEQTFRFQTVVFDARISSYDIYRSLVGLPGIDHVEVQDISRDITFPEPLSGRTRTDTIYLSFNEVQYYNDATSLFLTVEGGVPGGGS